MKTLFLVGILLLFSLVAHADPDEFTFYTAADIAAFRTAHNCDGTPPGEICVITPAAEEGVSLLAEIEENCIKWESGHCVESTVWPSDPSLLAAICAGPSGPCGACVCVLFNGGSGMPEAVVRDNGCNGTLGWVHDTIVECPNGRACGCQGNDDNCSGSCGY